MVLVKSGLPYEEFIRGRTVVNAMHREDDSAGDCIAEVDEARSGDTEIDDSTYTSIASEIKSYNDSIPEDGQTVINRTARAAKIARKADLHAKLAADTITDTEVREMLRIERGL